MLDAHAMNVCTGEANNKLLLLSSLRKQNLVEFVVQVGHDGVLQMAGFPPDQVANDSTAAGHVTTQYSPLIGRASTRAPPAPRSSPGSPPS